LYALPSADFHDITSGFNGFPAGTGYDLVTGRGTPVANSLIPAMTGNTATGLATSADPVVAGQPFTLTASVTGGNLNGTITYMDGNTVLGTSTLNASGQGILAVAGLSAGSHMITAIYGGDTNNIGSTSNPVGQTVDAANTSVVLTASANETAPGQAVTFTATVSVQNPGSGTPGGTVIFTTSSGVLGSAVLDANGCGSFTTSALPVGDNAVAATYTGSANYNNSTSATFHEFVYPGPAVSSIVVNGGAPQYVDSQGYSYPLAGQNSVVEQILVTFNEPVSLAPGAFSIINNAAAVSVVSGPAPNALPVTAIQTPVANSGNMQWIVTFAGPGTINISYGGIGTVIRDGVYILHINASSVAAIGNGVPISADVNSGFWALFGSVYDNTLSANIGDGNSEVFVDANDFNLFRLMLDSGADSSNTYGPPYYSVAMDYDLSGFYDTVDFNAFVNYQSTDWIF
jgi:hypothetical protein